MRRLLWTIPIIFFALYLSELGFAFAQTNPSKGYVISKVDIASYYQPQQQCSFVINVEHCLDTGTSLFIAEQFRVNISTCTLQDAQHNWLKQNFWCAYNTFSVAKDMYARIQTGQYINTCEGTTYERH